MKWYENIHGRAIAQVNIIRVCAIFRCVQMSKSCEFCTWCTNHTFDLLLLLGQIVEIDMIQKEDKILIINIYILNNLDLACLEFAQLIKRISHPIEL